MTLVSPLYVMQSKRKKFYLNLNVYRNTHYIVLSKTKVAYAKLMQEQVRTLPVYDRIHLTYTLYPKTKRLTDISNVLSIVDKYFCDCLVKAGKLPDDNYLFLPLVIYKFGSVDKTNPRVEIEITPL
jgi:Holliday junction resolvase RusA-like endonuclease